MLLMFLLLFNLIIQPEKLNFIAITLNMLNMTRKQTRNMARK